MPSGGNFVASPSASVASLPNLGRSGALSRSNSTLPMQAPAPQRAHSSMSVPALPSFRRTRQRAGEPPDVGPSSRGSSPLGSSRAITPLGTGRSCASSALDVVRVCEVDRAQRNNLKESDKRTRRAVYDAIRACQPEFTRGRGGIKTISTAPQVPTREATHATAPLDFSFSDITDVVQIVCQRAPRSGLAMENTVAAEAARQARRRQREAEMFAKEREAERLRELYSFGDDNAAFVAAQSQQQTGVTTGTAGASTAAQAPAFKPGVARMWGPRAPIREKIIVIAAREETYAFSRTDAENGVPANKDMANLSVAETFFNTLQSAVVDARGDKVYELEKDARRFTVPPPVNPREAGRSPRQTPGGSSGNAPDGAPEGCVQRQRYKLKHLKMNNNSIAVLDVADLARAVNFLTLPDHMALRANYLSMYREGTRSILPLQFITSIDLSFCGITRIVMPGTDAAPRLARDVLEEVASRTSPARRRDAHGHTHVDGQLSADVIEARAANRNKRPGMGAVLERNNKRRSESRSRRRAGASDAYSHSQHESGLAPWHEAPCAVLRHLTTLYLHGNALKSSREVLRFASIARDTLVALSWHGNPGIDAEGAAARRAAVHALPALATLNFTAITAADAETRKPLK